MLEWKKEAEKRIKEIDGLRENSLMTVDDLIARHNRREDVIELDIRRYFDSELIRILDQIDVEEVNRYKAGIKLSIFIKAGYNSINKLRNASVQQLSSIKGVGFDSVNRLKRIISAMVDEASRLIVLRFDPDNRDALHTKILKDIYLFRYGDKVYYKGEAIRRSSSEEGFQYRLSNLFNESKSVFCIFWNADKKSGYKNRIETLYREVQEKIVNPVAQLQKEYVDLEDEASRLCWDDFVKNSAEYYSFVEKKWPVKSTVNSYSGLSGNVDGSEGEQKTEIQILMEKIDAFSLDLSDMKTDLRMYQEFGAKFVLSQSKVLIGDEMGLGKTIEAIAVMAHLYKCGKTVFLVVCPLSILVNWEREIRKHSSLDTVIIHGNPDQRYKRFREWEGSDKIGITTYEMLDKLPFEEIGGIGILVVDEAHNVKNPSTKRTRNARKLIGISNYVLYMTGTPLENRIEEMRFLIESLNSEIGKTLKNKGLIKETFRKQIAPVYLRRTREDVLKELPELIEIEDWLLMDEEEEKKYVETLLQRNYMRVRRISWNVEPISKSTKANKLLEICGEAKEDNRKILVFSYFLDTIDIVEKLIREDCVGKITGATSVDERQRLIDRFTEAEPGSVLISQVTTGGIGLNIQAASVVVFCEPQFKPSTEEQALSRAYRIGQARTVMVHRLLITNSIEERMMDRLRAKKELFEGYAENSSMGEANVASIDEKDMAQFVEEELRKRGIEGNVATEVPLKINEKQDDVINLLQSTNELPPSQPALRLSSKELSVETEKTENIGEDTKMMDLNSQKDYEKDRCYNVEALQESCEKDEAVDTVRWSKFVEDFCNDNAIEEMISENAKLIADVEVNDQDVIFALEELRDERHREKVLSDLLEEGYKVSVFLLTEWFESEGNGETLRMMLRLFEGEIPSSLVAEFADWGCDDATMAYLLNRVENSFSVEDVIKIVEAVRLSRADTEKLLKGMKGTPTYEQLDELWGSINDDSLYHYIKPFVAKLPMEQRLEFKSMYE